MTNEQALAWEEGELAKADRDIVAGEQRIADQVNLIAHLEHEGHDTREALLLLETFRQTLQTWCDHRQLIRDRIADLK